MLYLSRHEAGLSTKYGCSLLLKAIFLLSQLHGTVTYGNGHIPDFIAEAHADFPMQNNHKCQLWFVVSKFRGSVVLIPFATSLSNKTMPFTCIGINDALCIGLDYSRIFNETSKRFQDIKLEEAGTLPYRKEGDLAALAKTLKIFLYDQDAQKVFVENPWWQKIFNSIETTLPEAQHANRGSVNDYFSSTWLSSVPFPECALARNAKPVTLYAGIETPGKPLVTANVRLFAGGAVMSNAFATYAWSDTPILTRVAISSGNKRAASIYYDRIEAFPSDSNSYDDYEFALKVARDAIANTAYGKVRSALNEFVTTSLQDQDRLICLADKVVECANSNGTLFAGTDTLFSARELQICLLVRNQEMSKANRIIIVDQLPSLIRQRRYKMISKYIGFWCDIFTQTAGFSKAVSLCMDSRIAIFATCDANTRKQIMRADYSTKAWSSGCIAWQRVLNACLGDYNDGMNIGANATSLVRGIKYGKILEFSEMSRIAQISSVETLNQTNTLITDSQQQKPSPSSTHNSETKIDKPQDDSYISKAEDKAISEVRNKYPKMPSDQMQDITARLHRGFAVSGTGKASTASKSDIDNLVKSFRLTLEGWNLRNSESVIFFGVSMECLLQNFLRSPQLSTEDSLKRQEQLEWQIRSIDNFIEKLPPPLLDKPNENYSPNSLRKIVLNDLSREANNPLNPFFRKPLGKSEWDQYVSDINKIMEKQLQKYSDECRTVDMKLDNAPSPSAARIDSKAYLRNARKQLVMKSCMYEVARHLVCNFSTANIKDFDSISSTYKVKSVLVGYQYDSLCHIVIEPLLDNK